MHAVFEPFAILFLNFCSGRVGLFFGGKSVQKPAKRTAHDLLDVEEGKRMRYHGLLAMDAVSF